MNPSPPQQRQELNGGVPFDSKRWSVMDTDNTSRILTALRVLTTFYEFGETATLEDMENVRRWAGDEELSPADAAVIVVRQELDRRQHEQPRTGPQCVR